MKLKRSELRQIIREELNRLTETKWPHWVDPDRPEAYREKLVANLSDVLPRGFDDNPKFDVKTLEKMLDALGGPKKGEEY